MAKPIITTNAVGCREVVSNGENGFLVEVANTQALTQALEKLCKDKDLQEKFGIASRKKVCKEFSVESVVQQYLCLYDEVLSPKNMESKNKSLYASILKPIFDRALALILLLLFSPILCVVGLLIRIKLGSPVFLLKSDLEKMAKSLKSTNSAQ